MFYIDSLLIKIALIGILGVGAQWVAWRINRPAIALMLFAGIMAGPVLGLLNPENDFGNLLDPIVKLAVAIILFEGGLSLNFRDLRHAGSGVLRLVIIGVPLGWALGTAAGYYGAGLPLLVAALFGGIMVVTGPTVIGPLLRSMRVGNRVRDILKWEGIVNDPIGALLAIGIFAYIQYRNEFGADAQMATVVISVLGPSLIAAIIGGVLGWALTWAFMRGHVPEYLKAPVMLITVIGGFVGADLIMHESGLITVTIMGVVMANRPVFSSRALRRFKEDLTVLLISGVFILLSATLDWETMQKFQLQFLVFLALLLFVVRPLTVLPSLLFSDIPWRERLFIAWIAPRGIVAIAVTGLFALRLVDEGYEGADALVPLVFSVVIVTIIAHGFSASWVARKLGLDQGKGEDILIVGANRWTVAFAQFLKNIDIRAVIHDHNRAALRHARRAEIDTALGDLAEEAHSHDIDLQSFQQMLIATDNDSHNRLVAGDLGPEFGYQKITRMDADIGDMRDQGRGRILFKSGTCFDILDERLREGWQFSKTKLSDKFGWKDYVANLDTGEEPLALVKPDRRLLFFTTADQPQAEAGDMLISFVAPESREERAAQRKEKRGGDNSKD